MNWNKNKIKNNIRRNSCYSTVSAGLVLRQLQVVQYSSWSICLPHWVSLSWCCCQLDAVNSTRCLGFHDVCFIPIPDPAHTEHEHRTELFSSSFSIRHLQSLLPIQTELPCFGSFSAARKPSPTARAWQLRDRAGSKAERDLCLNRAKQACSGG